MSNVNGNKVGHPVVGIILGIAGIALAVLMTLLFGVIAGAVAGILGIVAALLGVSARRKGNRGTGAIVAGVLAVILAFTMTFTTVNTLKGMKEVAETSGVAPTFAQYMDNPYMGIAGIAVNAAKSGNTEDAAKTVQKELDALRAYMEANDKTEKTTETTETTETKGATTGFSFETKTGVGFSIGG